MKKIRDRVKNIRAWVDLKTHLIEGRSYFGLDDGIALFFILLGALGLIEDGPLPYATFWTDSF